MKFVYLDEKPKRWTKKQLKELLKLKIKPSKAIGHMHLPMGPSAWAKYARETK